MDKITRNEWVAVAVAVLVVGYSLFGGRVMSLINGNGSMQDTATAGSALENNNMNTNDNVNDMTDVVVNDIKVGTGAEVAPGQTLTVNYVLKLSDGTLIQDSKTLGQPFKFTLGAGQVIPGWERGFLGMKVGGSRNIVIPPQFGYGDTQAGPIPPNSTLVFTVELLDATNTAQ